MSLHFDSVYFEIPSQFHNSKSKMNTTSGFKTPKLPPGVPFGLSLDLFSHSTAKQNLLKEDDGFIITVHEKGSTPYPHLNGVKVISELRFQLNTTRVLYLSIELGSS